MSKTKPEDAPEHALEESITLEINPIGLARPSFPEDGPTPGWTVPAAPELLGRAAAHMHARASTYDAPDGERSMGKAVSAFNAITGHNLTESEGWLVMTLLKAVRGFARDAYRPDSFEDLIAYAALLAEAKGAGR